MPDIVAYLINPRSLEGPTLKIAMQAWRGSREQRAEKTMARQGPTARINKLVSALPRISCNNQDNE
jgi:hypothetical protein